ncbi:hypothetical protein MRX96_000343 [Rhipicephalus microplus]
MSTRKAVESKISRERPRFDAVTKKVKKKRPANKAAFKTGDYHCGSHQREPEDNKDPCFHHNQLPTHALGRRILYNFHGGGIGMLAA